MLPQRLCFLAAPSVLPSFPLHSLSKPIECWLRDCCVPGAARGGNTEVTRQSPAAQTYNVCLLVFIPS